MASKKKDDKTSPPPSSLAKPKDVKSKKTGCGQIDEACLLRHANNNAKKVICMTPCCGVYGHPPTHFMNACCPCTQSYCGPYGCYWG